MATTKVNMATTGAAQLLGNEGVWWRASSYEIVDGVIAPRRSAKVERYELWTQFSETETDDGPPLPYDALFKALWSVESDEEYRPIRELTATEEDKVLSWCRRYGLLGLLPHRALSITYGPVWDYVTRNGADADPDDEDLLRTQTGYSRVGSTWRQWKTVIIPADGEQQRRSPSKDADPQPVTDSSADFSAPGIVLSPLLGPGELEQEGFQGTWARHFPRSPSSRGFFGPNDDGFWTDYGEPVSDFVQAALLLRAAMDPSRKTGNQFSAEQLATLHSLLGNVSLTVHNSASGIAATRWRSGSLLAALALSGLQYQVEGGRLAVCAACNGPYFTAAYQAKWCSVRCAKRVRQQIFREKQKKQKRRKLKDRKPK